MAGNSPRSTADNDNWPLARAQGGPVQSDRTYAAPQWYVVYVLAPRSNEPFEGQDIARAIYRAAMTPFNHWGIPPGGAKCGLRHNRALSAHGGIARA